MERDCSCPLAANDLMNIGVPNESIFHESDSSIIKAQMKEASLEHQALNLQGKYANSRVDPMHSMCTLFSMAQATKSSTQGLSEELWAPLGIFSFLCGWGLKFTGKDCRISGRNPNLRCDREAGSTFGECGAGASMGQGHIRPLTLG